MAKVNSVFGAYADKLQVVVDKALDKFAPTWFENYFEWGVPQQTLSYVTAIGRSRIEAAASIITRGSSAPLRSRAGLDKLSGEIPPIAHKFAMREEDYRNYLMLLNMNVSDAVKQKAALDLLFGDVKKAGDGVMKRLDYMVLEGLSTGQITVTVTNNPDGVVADAIDLLHSNDNKSNATTDWGTSASATPIADIEGAVKTQSDKGNRIAKVLLTPVSWGKFRKCTEVKDYFGAFAGKTNNKVLPTLANVNQFLSEHNLPIIEIVDQSIGIEKDGVITTYRPFSDTNAVLVPDGKLGTIHNALAMEQMEPVDKVNYASFKQALIKKWRENDPWAEFTEGELNAFPGVDAIDQIHLISTTAAFSL